MWDYPFLRFNQICTGGAYMPPPSLPPASPNRVKDGPHIDRMHLHITCHFVCSSHHMKS